MAGYGRRSIAKDLNLKVPVLVRIVDDQQALEIHLSENTQREDITLCDEIEFAKRYISLHHGDRSSAAKHLGWTLSKMNERIELLTCIPEVLEALDEGQIKAGHALVLALFSETIQRNTLTKIIDEKWTVAHLRARANKIQIPLDTAKFDKAECNACIHNSQRQGGLFDFEESAAKCSNNKCFGEKNKAYMVTQKEALEEKYGKVLLLSESLPEDRNTVTEIIVGSDQYKEVCHGCARRIAVLDDSITGAAGSVIESQCTDNVCFKKCVTSHKKSTNGENKQEQGVAKASKPTKSLNNPKDSASQPAIELHKTEISSSAAAHLANTPLYQKALIVASLSHTTGFECNIEIATLMKKSEAELDALIEQATAHSLQKPSKIGCTERWLFLAQAACATPTGKEAIKTAWKPTKEVLEKYTTTGLEQICERSGFIDAVESRDAKAFNRAKKKKGDLIKLMLEFNFDWKGFCPIALTNLLPKK